MKKLYQLMEMYKEDACHFDDFNDKKIDEVLTKLNESLSSLKEDSASSYTQRINEFKQSLKIDEDKEVLNDFLLYCKNYNK